MYSENHPLMGYKELIYAPLDWMAFGITNIRKKYRYQNDVIVNTDISN
jgi:hypothetical protein